MAGKHIADANAATIEALHKILEVGVSGGILIVDSVKGNDTKAVSDVSIPFATITAAKTAATAGVTIMVMPGTYDEGDLAKDDINYYFLPGAKVIYTGEVLNTCIFADNNTAITLNVYGYGEFINNGTGGGNDVVHTEAVGTIFNIECIKMHSEINRAVGNDEATVTIRCKEISSCDAVIDTAGGTNGNAKTIIYADKITAISNFAIEHDGGDVEIYCDTIISESETVETITTASGSGNLFVSCNKLQSAFKGLSSFSGTTNIYLRGILFDTEDDNIDGTSTNPLLITIENCRSAANLPYLTGLNGVKYINRPPVLVANGATLPDGVEPDILIIDTGIFPANSETMEIIYPSNYHYESMIAIDTIGDFSSNTYTLRLKQEGAIVSSGSVHATFPTKFRNQEIVGARPAANPNAVIDADGDMLDGLRCFVQFNRAMQIY